MDRFFPLAQRAGFLEFIGLSHKKALEMPEDAKTLSLQRSKSPNNTTVHPHEASSSLIPRPSPNKLVQTQCRPQNYLEEQRNLECRNRPHRRLSAIFLERARQFIEQEGKRIFQFFCMKSDLARDDAPSSRSDLSSAPNTISIISSPSIKRGPNIPK